MRCLSTYYGTLQVSNTGHYCSSAGFGRGASEWTTNLPALKNSKARVAASIRRIVAQTQGDLRQQVRNFIEIIQIWCVGLTFR
jgi:hypothetical protein